MATVLLNVATNQASMVVGAAGRVLRELAAQMPIVQLVVALRASRPSR